MGHATEGDPVEPFPDQRFDPVRTAHYGGLRLEWDVRKKVYVPFPFLPAQVRPDDPHHFSYVTQCTTGAPGEPGTRRVEAAILEPNPQFRLVGLGVALHAIADTFSHFGFSGRWHDENDVKEIRVGHSKKKWSLQDMFRNYGDVFVPRIGHLEAFSLPDLPHMEWTYRDHNGIEHVRDNLASNMEGAELIYHFLKIAYNPPEDLTTLPALLQSPQSSKSLPRDHPGARKTIRELLKSKEDKDARRAAWKDFTGAAEYDNLKWRDQALEGDVDWDKQSHWALKNHPKRLRGKPGFENSKWA